MKAVILAGGRGTRLAPFTMILPKPLVPVGERPIIDIILRQLEHFGFRQVILTTGYLAELIQAYFAGSGNFTGLELSYVRENTPTGTAGSLSSIPDLDDTFLVMNGDVLTTLDYGALIEHHRRSGAALTIATHQKRIKVDLGVIETAPDGSVCAYSEKPEKCFTVSMGVYVYEPRVLTHIPRNGYLDFPDLVLRLLERGERVVTYASDAYWMDIGNHADYARAQEDFAAMQERLLYR